MAAPKEVVFTSDMSGQMWNVCVWDPYSGTTLTTFKGGVTAHRGLCVLGNEYLMSTSTTKPLIHVWSLHRKDQSQMKMVAPGKVNCLAVTHDGSYCVGAVNENIHVWQICSGRIVASVCRHYQKINVIRFTDNGSHFISGGDDNIVIVWSLSSVLSMQNSKVNKPEPVYIWSSHSLPVTDIHVGSGGYRCRVVTASLDQSCKVWDLVSGDLLQTIVFPSSILSVTMDASEHRLFSGGETGDIYCVQMYAQRKQSRQIHTAEENEITVFKGHSQKVKCLSMSMDCTRLISGSHDNTVKIWEVTSGQCVLTLNHKGHVTNVLMMTTPPALLNSNWTNQLPLQQFRSLRDENPASIIMNTRIQFSKTTDNPDVPEIEYLDDEEEEVEEEEETMQTTDETDVPDVELLDDENTEGEIVEKFFDEKVVKSHLKTINEILT